MKLLELLESALAKAEFTETNVVLTANQLIVLIFALKSAKEKTDRLTGVAK